MESKDTFQKALKNSKIPVLVLDQKWHRLFAIHGKTEEIEELELELKELLARQGKLNNELRELKKIKNKLLEEIVSCMDDISEEESEENSKLSEKRRLVNEANDRMQADEDELLDIPYLIKEKNEELMLLSMDYFYEKLRVNEEESREFEEWIRQTRIELKKTIIKKQNRDINNREIYSYLHDIFGAEVIDIFDIQYDNESEEEES